VIILSVESSCDETAVAVTRGREVLSSEIFSQVDIHALYGGVVPEIASRNHIEVISRLADSAVSHAGISKTDIGGVAVTYAPGLVGALLVGVNFAKSAAYALNVPLIPVHHIRGHIAANYIAYPELEPPFLCLIISGGHSLIVDVKSYTHMEIVGASRDDAAGECFDKAARVLGLGYPGGVQMDKLAKGGDDRKYPLPRPVLTGSKYDMSFSGLKTNLINLLHNAQQKGEEIDKPSLAASFAAAVSDILVPRTAAAAKEKGYDKIVIAGGVAANSRIRRDFEMVAKKEGFTLYAPPLSLCGDNAAMIGCQGYYEYMAGIRGDTALNAFAVKGI